MLGIVCHICGKRPATSHLTELGAESPERKELHICATCIQDLGLELNTSPPSIASILAKKAALGGGETSEDESEDPPETGPDITCPGCGLLLSEFSTKNRFGCARCYAAFKHQVDPLLTRYHGTSVHLGRVPAQADAEAAAVRLARRAHLDATLKEALAAEDYKRAATLRDELRSLDDER